MSMMSFVKCCRSRRRRAAGRSKEWCLPRGRLALNVDRLVTARLLLGKPAHIAGGCRFDLGAVLPQLVDGASEIGRCAFDPFGIGDGIAAVRPRLGNGVGDVGELPQHGVVPSVDIDPFVSVVVFRAGELVAAVVGHDLGDVRASAIGLQHHGREQRDQVLVLLVAIDASGMNAEQLGAAFGPTALGDQVSGGCNDAQAPSARERVLSHAPTPCEIHAAISGGVTPSGVREPCPTDIHLDHGGRYEQEPGVAATNQTPHVGARTA